MAKIFIDTGAFISYFVQEEAFHEEVQKAYDSYLQENAIFFTSNYVLGELYTWCVRKINQTLTTKIITSLNKTIAQGRLHTVYIDGRTDEIAQELLLKFFEHKLSFTDCTTAALFKNLNLDEIFTLDSDFKKLRLPVSFPRFK